MKRILFLLCCIFLIVVFSCKQPKPKDEDTELEHQTEVTIHSIKEGDVEIIEIDGCQYIVYKETTDANHGFGYMAHKGNCSNSFHKNPVNVERSSIIEDTIQ